MTHRESAEEILDLYKEARNLYDNPPPNPPRCVGERSREVNAPDRRTKSIALEPFPCNSQKELTPLEIGNHALGLKAQGKAGKGMKAYAKRVGLDTSELSRLLRPRSGVLFRLTGSSLK